MHVNDGMLGMARLATEIVELRRALGRGLAAHREAAGKTQASLGRATGYARTSIAHIETGRQFPDERFWHLADQICGTDGALVAAYARVCDQEAVHTLAALQRANTERRQRAERALPRNPDTSSIASSRPGGPYGDNGARLAHAAEQSIDFAQWASADQVDQLSIESLSYELSRIAREYVHAPMQPLFGDLLVVRDRVRCVLESRPHPRQARELFYLGGVTVVLLAHASQNLGDSMAAMQHALAAQGLADQADHSGLRRWVVGTQALIAEWTGHPERAVELARRAADHSPTGQDDIRALALEARASARLGDADVTRAALRRLRDALGDDSDDRDGLELGGVLSFPTTKALYYAGTAQTLVGDYDSAERDALAAITAWETGPAHLRSYGDEALARADVAVSRLARDEPDGAAEALAPVLSLEPDKRIRQIADGLRLVRSRLKAPRYERSPVAHALRAQLDAFKPIPVVPQIEQ